MFEVNINGVSSIEYVATINADNDIKIFAFSIKEEYSVDGESVAGNEFTDAINNYKAGDVVYVPYTVTISYTDYSSNKVDMTYTYEDVMLVYIMN